MTTTTTPPVEMTPDKWPEFAGFAGPSRISHACFVTWARHDPDGLAAHKASRGGLIVRVPVPRQRWPNRTMTD